MVPYTGYVDVSGDVASTIADGPTTNVRITNTAASTPITMAASGITRVNSLLFSQSGTTQVQTITIGDGNTLVLGQNGGIYNTTGTGGTQRALTIGSAGVGTLTAGDGVNPANITISSSLLPRQSVTRLVQFQQVAPTTSTLPRYRLHLQSPPGRAYHRGMSDAPAPYFRSRELLSRDDSKLLIVDVQEKFMPTIPVADQLIRNCRKLLEGAKIVGVPAFATEQYPKGLGPTVGPIREALAKMAPPPQPVEKVEFDACSVPAFATQLEAAGKRSVVLTGMEAHICVYQTARELVRRGFRVHIPLDAVASRTPENLAVAEKLYERTGAISTSTETVLFDLLGRAQGDAFKAISKLVK